MVGSVTTERIHLQEYGAPLLIHAERLNLDAVAEVNRRWVRELGLTSAPLRITKYGDGFIQLRAEAVTGVVRVGHTHIEISPKFLSAESGSWQSVLWRILSTVEGGHIDDNLSTSQESASPSMPDLLAEMFLTSYAKGAARGLPRGYQAENSSGTVLRGRLDVSRLSEWVARPWEIPYVTDYLSDDTELSRLLRWTAESLAATVGSSGRARVLREIAGSLSHVERLPPHFLDAQKIQLGPQHQGLEAAKTVGILLLEGGSVHHAQGAHAISGFLWKSDTIYENYIYWLCKRAATKLGFWVDKSRIQFGNIVSGKGARLETIPDVIFRKKDGTAAAIIDAKYKNFGSRPKAADTYQVLTAGQVLGCQRISLTYPVAKYREPTVWRVSSALGGSDIELTSLPLNLMSLVFRGGEETLINMISHWLEKELFTEPPVRNERTSYL